MATGTRAASPARPEQPRWPSAVRPRCGIASVPGQIAALAPPEQVRRGNGAMTHLPSIVARRWPGEHRETGPLLTPAARLGFVDAPRRQHRVRAHDQVE